MFDQAKHRAKAGPFARFPQALRNNAITATSRHATARAAAFAGLTNKLPLCKGPLCKGPLCTVLLGVVLNCVVGCSGGGSPVSQPPARPSASPADSGVPLDSVEPIRPQTPLSDGIDTAWSRFAFTEQRLPAAVYRNGQEAGRSSIVESLGGGVAMFDFDRDGWLDLGFTGGGLFAGNEQLTGLPTVLLRNGGDAQWQPVAELARLATNHQYSHGIHAADFNNDGFGDVLITGYDGLQFWRNQGDGSFVDVTAEAGWDAWALQDRVSPPGGDASETTPANGLWSSSAAWGDFNRDGALDVYVARYVDWSFENDPHCPGPTPADREICSPKDFQGLADALYFSLGDGRFEDGSAAAGLREGGKGLGALACDLDLDGDLDVYVANDTTDNFFYRNPGDGRLDEQGLAAGVAVDGGGIANGSMGATVLDYNLDGRPDICVANYERETTALYRNVSDEGDSQFLYVSKSAGLTSLGQLYVGFGAISGDLDHDGDEDLVVANGHVVKFPHVAPRRQLPLLLENRRGRFERVEAPADSYFAHAQEGRGLASGDLDRDGDLDLVVTHLNEPAAILWNTIAEVDWLAVELIGSGSPRDAIGARLELVTPDGLLVRQVVGGGSYLSTSDARVHWGLPQDTRLQELLIRWPAGGVQRIAPVPRNRLLQIREPKRAD